MLSKYELNCLLDKQRAAKSYAESDMIEEQILEAINGNNQKM